MLRNQKGFTLMELMIVIVIIGVLAAIGVPAYNNYVKSAKEKACAANVSVIQNALYIAAAESSVGDIDDVTLDDAADNLTGGVLPTCPLGGTYSAAAGVVSCNHGD